MNSGRILVCILIICSSLFATPAAATIDTEPDQSPVVEQSTSETVPITQTLQKTPDTPGSITVTTTVETTLKLTQFNLYIPRPSEELSVTGFSRGSTDDVQGFKKYEWDGNTDSPAVTYSVEVNTTGDRGGFETVDAGDWAIIAVPDIPYAWEASEEVQITRQTELAGSGVVKVGYAYLGEYEERTHTAHDQQFRLITPEAATLAERPEAIFDSVSYASDKLRVGERDDEVVMIAAPSSETIRWNVGGTARDSVFWAVDRATVNTTNNIWIHEYVHTRQDFTTTDDFEWFTEGSAEYYAALFTLQQEQIGFDQFRLYFKVREDRYSDAVLRDTSSDSLAAYYKGGLVAGYVDQQIRLASNGSASLTALFERLNAEEEEVSNEDFLRYVGLFSTSDIESDVRAATTTPASLSMWDRAEHTAAFGEEPPEMEGSVDTDYRLDDFPSADDSESDAQEKFAKFIAYVLVGGIGLAIIGVPVALGVFVYRKLQ
ncbi:hypothetical protein EGH24_09170 [Halonotius terrestris]|uniref:Uncharacterized protein n=1 Tax=Halonotius terrestris TaxID=2487750 RepID=A0A8J8PD34_9EURY|nr:hypothetical protein [Halonotius terrestris]TQQ81284.1 hypothetical protein EGH24_09170 [Halonotius terrestris]